jgi:hypothetical protein
VLAAVKSFDALDFNGLAPTENYVGTPDEQLQRTGYITQPSLDDLANGGAGTVVLESEYSGPTAQAFTFEGACYSLGG